MKKALLFVITITSALAQQDVSVSSQPPYVSYSSLYFYSGTDLQYSCKARSQQPTATFARSDSTLTNIIVLTNVGTATTGSAHGLSINDKIVITGASVDLQLNGTFAIATVPSTTTFTITTASVSDATYTESTLQFTTTAPRDTRPIWSIQKFTYVSSALTQAQWANGTSAPNQICANRATLSFQ